MFSILLTSHRAPRAQACPCAPRMGTVDLPQDRIHAGTDGEQKVLLPQGTTQSWSSVEDFVFSRFQTSYLEP